MADQVACMGEKIHACKIYMVSLKERDHLGELVVEGRSVKWDLREVDWGEMVWDSTGVGQGRVASCWEYGYELLRCLK
jgi:hypothetical protein